MGNKLSVAVVAGTAASAVAFQHGFLPKTGNSISGLQRVYEPKFSTFLQSSEEGVTAEPLQIENIKPNDVFEGTVSGLTSYGAFIDIGAASSALLHVSQISDTFVSAPSEILSEGQKVQVRVVEVDADTQKISVSMRSGEVIDIQSKYGNADKSVFMAAKVEFISEIGASVRLVEDNVPAFLHISQLSEGRVDKVTDVIAVGQEIQVRIEKVDAGKNQLRVSMRPVQEREVKDISKFLDVSPSEVLEGTVARVTDFGVFVNVDGCDGLVHISKISSSSRRTSVDDMKAKFKEGDSVKVNVIEVDQAKGRLGLAIAQGKAVDLNTLSVGDYVEGEVVSTTGFGAFVDIGGVEGLIHVSQLAEGRVESVESVVSVGQTVKARVLAVSPDEGKINLSLKSESSRAPQSSATTQDVSKYQNFDSTQVLSGTVARIAPFGAFITLEDGVEGLVHVSKLTADYVEEASQVVQVGQKVEVRVIECNMNNNQLGLTMIPAGEERSSSSGSRESPVAQFANADPTEFISGTVVSVQSYGAFVNIAEGVDGLVHFSAMKSREPSDEFEVGQEVQVRILGVDLQKNNVQLSSLTLEEEKESQAQMEQSAEAAEAGNVEFDAEMVGSSSYKDDLIIGVIDDEELATQKNVFSGFSIKFN